MTKQVKRLNNENVGPSNIFSKHSEHTQLKPDKYIFIFHCLIVLLSLKKRVYLKMCMFCIVILNYVPFIVLTFYALDLKK